MFWHVGNISRLWCRARPLAEARLPSCSCRSDRDLARAMIASLYSDRVLYFQRAKQRYADEWCG